MVFNYNNLSTEEKRVLRFLNEAETRQLKQSLDKLEALEKLAVERYEDYLRDNVDLELSELVEGLPDTEKKLGDAIKKKLKGEIKDYGNFAFAVWDWEWRPEKYAYLTATWESVFQYEIDTWRDFHCIVFTDSERTAEWAQYVYDKFFSLKMLKELIGMDLSQDTGDRILHNIARELMPVAYES